MVVSKNIVELHGGHIDVRSKAGKGTTVTVNLPMGVAKEV
jgi:signal transduction histidine kinase